MYYEYMPAILRILLSPNDLRQLETMLRKGRWSPRQLKRAQILLLAHKQADMTNAEIGTRLFCARETVRQVRDRYRRFGLAVALGEKRRPGQPKKISGSIGRYILALCLEKKPIGYNRWTLPLLQKRLLKDFSYSVSTETIRRFLLKQKKDAQLLSGR